jgi:myo-inositol-1(or 4)-monophosphatase
VSIICYEERKAPCRATFTPVLLCYRALSASHSCRALPQSFSSALPGSTPEQLLGVITQAAREAGRMAMPYFHLGETTSARIWNKAGGSPVTQADVAVDAFLKTSLSILLPDVAWLSEETADDHRRLNKKRVWIVDPIDGTRAFLSGHPDWSIVIALLEDDKPVLGVVYAPALDVSYEAVIGGGAFCNNVKMQVSAPDSWGVPRIAGPVSLIDRLKPDFRDCYKHPKIPSLALRIARVAEGIIDAGLVTANARDWDLAAADLILQEAGGFLSDIEGSALVYNRPDPVHGELVAAPKELHKRLITAMREE